MRQLATLLILAITLPAQAFAAVQVPINQGRRVAFTGQAANVVVGNPQIADVSIVDTRTLLVTGKRYGVTNLIVLDTLGRTLFDNEIVVSAGEGSVVSVFRGGQSAEYSCSPYCQQLPSSDQSVVFTPQQQAAQTAQAAAAGAAAGAATAAAQAAPPAATMVR